MAVLAFVLLRPDYCNVFLISFPWKWPRSCKYVTQLLTYTLEAKLRSWLYQSPDISPVWQRMHFKVLVYQWLLKIGVIHCLMPLFLSGMYVYFSWENACLLLDDSWEPEAERSLEKMGVFPSQSHSGCHGGFGDPSHSLEGERRSSCWLPPACSSLQGPWWERCPVLLSLFGPWKLRSEECYKPSGHSSR